MVFGKLEDVVKAGAGRLGRAVQDKIDEFYMLHLTKFEMDHQTASKVINLSISGLNTVGNAAAGGLGGYLAVQEAIRFSQGMSSGPEFYGTVGLGVAVEGVCLYAASFLGRDFYQKWKSYFPGKAAADVENGRTAHGQR